LNPGRDKRFFVLQIILTVSGIQAASYSMGAMVLPRVKAA